MDAISIALLTIAALLVGMLAPVLFQLYVTLREVRTELRDVRERMEPLIGSMQRTTQLTTAITAAVAAAVRAFKAAEQDRPVPSPQPESSQ